MFDPDPQQYQGFPPPGNGDEAFFGSPPPQTVPSAGHKGGSEKGRRSRREKKGTTSAKGPTRNLTGMKVGIVVALLLGVVAAVGVGTKAKQTYVAEAGKTISPLSTVKASDLRAVAIPSSAIESGAYTGPNAKAAIKKAAAAVVGKSTAYPLSKNEQLVPSLFSSSVGGKQGPVGPNSRLISVSATTSAAVGGTLTPGDVVDVVSVFAQNGTPVSTVVAQDITVVAANPTASALPQSGSGSSNLSSSAATGGGVYVLSVPTNEVTAVAMADALGKIYLAYEGPGATPIPNLSQNLGQVETGNGPQSSTASGAVCLPGPSNPCVG